MNGFRLSQMGFADGCGQISFLSVSFGIMRRLFFYSGSWVLVVGLLVCVGLMFVLVPHAHADGSAGQLSKPCSVCGSKQTVSGLAQSTPVLVDSPPIESTLVLHAEDPHSSVSELFVWTGRAPPAA